MAKNDNYHVGISTGFWYIGRDPNLLGLAQKIGGLGATGGVNFVQVDLETISEFYEPEVKTFVKRMMDKLGMVVGMHGEIAEVMSVDAAEKRIWDQTHERLVQTVRYAADLGFIYVNIHFSFRPILSFVESQQRLQGYYYPVVDPYGRGLQEIVRENKQLEEEVIRHLNARFIFDSPVGREETRKLEKEIEEKVIPKLVEEEFQRYLRENPDATDRDKKNMKETLRANFERSKEDIITRRRNTGEFVLKIWKNLRPQDFERYILDDGEFGAFHIIAHWMKNNNDYLWSTIAGNANPNDLYFDDENAFNAAVASKYLEGHVVVKNNKENKKYLNGMSIKEWCESKGLYLLFENPEANRGQEYHNRLFDPKHYYHTIKNLKSSHVKICLDIEHMVSHKLDPDKELPKLPNDFGKFLFLLHLGQPVPYGGTSHIPISRGTVAQEQIYRWMYWLKKKGFGNGYVIFERGSGRSGGGKSPFEVFEDSVQTMRQIVKYLDQDIHWKNLPPEFYGISMDNKGVWSRQKTAIREHAWDPLDGLLSVPEEKHTFLGKSAVDKGKAQEWEKRKFR